MVTRQRGKIVQTYRDTGRNSRGWYWNRLIYTSENHACV